MHFVYLRMICLWYIVGCSGIHQVFMMLETYEDEYGKKVIFQIWYPTFLCKVADSFV